MITRPCLQSAKNIAYSLEDVWVAPVPGSLIDGLTKAAAPAMDVKILSDEDIINSSRMDNSSMGTHSEIQNDAVKRVAEIIGDIAGVARNVINPRIGELVEKINSEIEGYSNTASDLDIKINLVNVPAPLTNPLLDHLMTNYRNADPHVDMDKIRATQSVIGKLTLEEAHEAMMTGSAGLDPAIKEILSGVETDVSPHDIAISAIEHLTVNDNVGWSDSTPRDLMLAGLMVNGLLEFRVDRVGSMLEEDSDLRLALTLVRATLFRTLNLFLEQMEDYAKEGRLQAPIRFYKPTKWNVFVNGPVYRDWVRGEGSPEAILGWAASSSRGTMDPSVKNNPGQWVEKFEEKLRHRDHLASVKQEEITRSTVRRVVYDWIREDDELDESGKNDARNRLKQALSAFPTATGMSTREFCMEVLCRVYTEGPDVLCLLKDIDQQLQRMDEPDMKYAVFIAHINLIGRWIGKQYLVKPLP